MSFSQNKLLDFSNKISSLPDEPAMQASALKAYFDSSPTELQQAHNGLCDALTAVTAASSVGFQRTAGVPADTVQSAVEHVQQQVSDAVMGNVPSGSIDNDKLSQEVRDHFTSIENSVTSEAQARKSADSNLQSQITAHNSQISAKCEILSGSYSGNGTENRFISLGRTPKAVLVMTNCGIMYLDNIQGTMGGLAATNSPVVMQGVSQPAVKIVTNGFQVTYGGQYNCLQTNASGEVYNYIAFC